MRTTFDGAGHIRARDLTFRYADSGAAQLRAVSFTVSRGERLAIMGATGSGKTTLCRTLNGLVPHHHEGRLTGELTVAGVDVARSTVPDLVRHVGLVLQDPEAQITGSTVLRDAAVGPANLGLARTEVVARAERALRAVGLADIPDRSTAELSGGQRQRLAIAGVVAMSPEILVLDEPTSELEPAGCDQVIEVIRGLSADRTVLLVTHDSELVIQWAQRLLVLADGAIAYDGEPIEFFADSERVAQAGLRPPGVIEVVTGLRERGLLPAGSVGEPACTPGEWCAGAAGGMSSERPTSTVDGAVALLRRHLFVNDRGAVPEPTPTPDGPVVIAAEQLTHRYPSGVEALTGVDLRVRRGEFVALLGGNGAGKTTFARHLNGLLRPTSGHLAINGRPTAGRTVSDLATEVGHVFQNPDHQIFADTVADEIGFGLANQGHNADEIDRRVAEVLDQVGMAGMASLHPYQLGKGQRQRLAVASVLALRPQILVIDEPTTGQDWCGSVAIMDLIRDLNDAGCTILVITHDMLLAARYAHRAVVFDAGRVRADRPIRELLGDRELLAEVRLRPPQITALATELGLGPLTSVEEYLEVVGVDAR